LLLRNFTQNIDTLERVSGIPGEALVEAHGSFSNSHCISCHQEESTAAIKEKIFKDEIPLCPKCGSLVKPDIVFFGESLPARYFELTETDFPKCDLLLVLGTSLQVHPFASLIHKVKDETPRLLINREKVGMSFSTTSQGFEFGRTDNYRDVAYIGDLQEGVKKLVSLLGWEKELEKMVEEKNEIANFDFDFY